VPEREFEPASETANPKDRDHPPGMELGAAQILHLHRAIGNRAVVALLQRQSHRPATAPAAAPDLSTIDGGPLPSSAAIAQAVASGVADPIDVGRLSSSAAIAHAVASGVADRDLEAEDLERRLRERLAVAPRYHGTSAWDPARIVDTSSVMSAGYSASLPRRLIEHYAHAEGAPLFLTEEDMRDCAPSINLRATRHRESGQPIHERLHAVIVELLGAGQGERHVTFEGPATAGTHGTLGHFTVIYSGTVRVHDHMVWQFQGQMMFWDTWDFNASSRGLVGELLTGIGRYGLPGRPFPVYSARVRVSQSSHDDHAIWSHGPLDGQGGAPSRVAPAENELGYVG
jgi:hypothetical protein